MSVRRFTHAPTGRSVVVLSGGMQERLVVADANWAESELVRSEGAPDGSWKVADLKAWAEAHDVDLDGATKKADILAIIVDPSTEKSADPDDALPAIPADPSIEQTDLPE